MDTAYVVLLVLLVIYIPIYIWVWRCPEAAERYHLSRYGPALMIKTRLGFRTMDRLARYTRFWLVFGFISKIISAVLLFLMMYMMVVAIMAIPSRIGSSSIGIEYALAIPGFNPIMPLSYGVVALVVAMVVHELGHGIQTRANGARVDSSGLLYGVIPLGAFVEPNEEDMAARSRRVRMDMYTAGISVNTFVAIGSIAVLILACGAVTSDHSDDVGVYAIDSGSPAYIAGIPASAIVTGVQEYGSDTFTEVDSVQGGGVVSIDYDFDPSMYYILQYETEDGTHATTEPVQMGAFIKSVTNGSPADRGDVGVGQFIYSLTSGGVVTQIHSTYDFMSYMATTEPGQVLTLTTVTVAEHGGSPEFVTHEGIVLADRSSQGFLGLSVTTGGMTLTTPGILLDKAKDPFYGATDPFSYVSALFTYLSGPFNGMDPISDEVRWWYDAPGDDIFWIAVTMLYWIFWLDILLAISNALPAYPFDGGFIFAGGVNWLLERFGVTDTERRDRISDSVSNSVSTVVLFMFMMVILSFII